MIGIQSGSEQQGVLSSSEKALVKLKSAHKKAHKFARDDKSRARFLRTNEPLKQDTIASRTNMLFS